MLLRASGESTGNEVDVQAVTDDGSAAASGIPHAPELLAFAEASVAADESALASAREGLLDTVGPEGLVDAAAVVGNFERMTRIADGTGIPLDAPVNAMAADIQQDLGLVDFGSAGNTRPASAVARTVGRLARPLVSRLMGVVGRRMNPDA